MEVGQALRKTPLHPTFGRAQRRTLLHQGAFEEEAGPRGAWLFRPGSNRTSRNRNGLRQGSYSLSVLRLPFLHVEGALHVAPPATCGIRRPDPGQGDNPKS